MRKLNFKEIIQYLSNKREQAFSSITNPLHEISWPFIFVLALIGFALATLLRNHLGSSEGSLTGYVAIVVALPTAYMTYMRQRSSEAQNKINAQNQINSQIAHYNDRYVTGVELFTDDKTDKKIAGVSVLISLANDWHALDVNTKEQDYSVRISETLSVLSDYLNKNKNADEKNQDVLLKIHSGIRSDRNKFKWDLSFADLTGANLTGANLTGADLSRADLSRAELVAAKLTNTQLWYTKLEKTQFALADFTSANLIGADLTGADLRDADLTGANFVKADLTGANLTGAKFMRAAFVKDKHVAFCFPMDSISLIDPSYNYQVTLFSEGFDPVKAGMIDISDIEKTD